MKSSITLICPVSGKRARAIPLTDAIEGEFVHYEPEDDAPVDLPLGWGRLVLDVHAKNPEHAAALAQRSEAAREAKTSWDAALADAKVPEDQKAQLRAELESGQAAEQLETVLDDRFPLPEEYVLMRLQYPVLSDDAVTALVKALRAAGFPMVLNGAVAE